MRPLLLRSITFSVCLAPLLMTSACQELSEARPKGKKSLAEADYELVIPHFAPQTVASLKTIFRNLDYSWQSFEEGIPPFILEQFPNGLDNELGIQEKKRTFFMGLLPMVLLANQEIAQQRADLLDILQRHENGLALEETERQRLNDLTERYGLRGNPLRDHRLRSRLLRRVDTIPPALVLAQAANESAWGTSRFARQGNNLFGQWTFKPGTGIVPRDRPPGATYEVRRFRSLYDSVRSYMHNLNTHGAYRELRQIRADLRRRGKPVSGRALAKGLTRYSTRAEAYVQEIQAMIRHNRLSRFNQFDLRQPSAEEVVTRAPGGSGLLASRSKIAGQLSEAWANPEL